MNSNNEGRDAAINLLNNCGEELEQAKDALRSIASYMGNGSYDTDNFDYSEIVDSLKKSIDVYIDIEVQRKLSPIQTQHPDDIAVDTFAAAMKAKLAKKREQGRGGWNNKEDCSEERLQMLLLGHVAKGDPVDVGNFAMMLFNRGEKTQFSTEVQEESVSQWISVDEAKATLKDGELIYVTFENGSVSEAVYLLEQGHYPHRVHSSYGNERIEHCTHVMRRKAVPLPPAPEGDKP